MKNNQKNTKNNSKSVIKIEKKVSKFDPFGSYTGLSIDGEKPVQDQDDLWKNHQ